MSSCWPAIARGYGSHARMVSPAGTASGSTVSDCVIRTRRAAAWKARLPDEVDLIEPHFDEHAGLLRLHSFYVRYRLPVMLEVQHFEYLVRA